MKLFDRLKKKKRGAGPVLVPAGSPLASHASEEKAQHDGEAEVECPVQVRGGKR